MDKHYCKSGAKKAVKQITYILLPFVVGTSK